MSTVPFFGADTYEVHQGHFLSVQMMELAGDIRAMYGNLRLVWVPPEYRGPEDKGKEFAILDEDDNDTPVMRMSPEQVTHRYIFDWLWEHDATRPGNNPWEKLMEAEAQAAKEKKEKSDEEAYRQADLVHSIAKSGKSDYKHNGVKLTDAPSSVGEMLHGN